MAGLVLKYWRWCESMMKADPARADFYEALRMELRIDYFTDQRLGEHVPYPDDPLAVWKYDYLDQDGDTTKICEALVNGQDIFAEDGVGPATEKYGHLAPPGYSKAIIKMRVMNWEYEWLDDAAAGTKRLERWLDRRIDVFDHAPPEVINTYAYLLPAGWEPVTTYCDWCREYAMKRDAGQSQEGWAIELVADYERPAGSNDEFRNKFVTFVKERYLHINEENEAIDSTKQGPKDNVESPQERALPFYTTEYSKYFSSELSTRLRAVNGSCDLEQSRRATWPILSSLMANCFGEGTIKIPARGYNAGLGLRIHSHSWPVQEGRETMHHPMSVPSSVE